VEFLRTTGRIVGPAQPPIKNAVHFTRTFQFSQPSFNISAPTPPNFGGFTSLGRDTSLHGRVKITKIRITLDAKSKSNVGFGDIWAFLGPQALVRKPLPARNLGVSFLRDPQRGTK
jgi:hypothetical protein